MTSIITDPTTFPHAFDAALNAGELDQLVALYAEDATLRTQSDDIVSGAAAVRAEMKQLMAAKADITNTLRRIFRYGDTALIIVDYVLRLTMPDGKPVTVNGTATNVIREDKDKGWRLVVANPQGVN